MSTPATQLDRAHPINITVGACMIGSDIAFRNGHSTERIIFADALAPAKQARELLREIATEANDLAARIVSACADGIVTEAERAELLSAATEIATEARVGRVIAS